MNLETTGTRRYRQTARAASAERTRRNILASAIRVWRARGIEEATLNNIAEEAGVSVQTVLRKFGSRDGLVEACIEEDASGIREFRDQAPVGRPAEALDVLLAHYERDGDDILWLLDMETRSDAARKIVKHGRERHREWCARVFEPFLPAPGAAEYRGRLDALVAATDLYLWKLFRRDQGASAGRTRGVFDALVGGLLRTGAGGPAQRRIRRKGAR